MHNPQKNRTEIYIDTTVITENSRKIRTNTGKSTGIIFVAKSNCMGFGLVETVKAAVAGGVDKIAVSELKEAILLRKNKVTLPILLLYQPVENELNTLIENDIEISISNPSIVEKIIQLASDKKKQVNVDLFLETGMHRYGLQFNDIERVTKRLCSNPYVTITGISSHFATTDTDIEFAKDQLDLFIESVKIVTRFCSSIRSVHIANTGATMQFHDSWKKTTYKKFLPDAKVYIRVFRAIVGATAIQNLVKVEPAFKRVTTVITEVQDIKKGDFIGYDKSFQTDKDISIATIPVGWANAGYYFRKAFVVVNNTKCKMLGFPSANALTFENTTNAQPGDTVYLVKQDGEGEQVTLEELATLNGITHTHITSSLGGFLPKIYLK